MTPQPTSPITKRNTVASISGLFAWCRDRHLIQVNPWDKLQKTIKVSTRGGQRQGQRRPWNQQELEVGLKGLDGQLRDFMLIGLYSGMRAAEVCEMKTSDITDEAFHVTEGKSSAAVRAVPVHPILQPLVKRLLKTSKDGYLLSGLKAGGDDGKRSHGLTKKFGRGIRKLGIADKGVVYHSLRGSFSQALEDADVNENIAQQIVGHAKQSLTFGVYSKGVSMEVLREAFEQVTYEVDELVREVAG